MSLTGKMVKIKSVYKGNNTAQIELWTSEAGWLNYVIRFSNHDILFEQGAMGYLESHEDKNGIYYTLHGSIPTKKEANTLKASFSFESNKKDLIELPNNLKEPNTIGFFTWLRQQFCRHNWEYKDIKDHELKKDEWKIISYECSSCKATMSNLITDWNDNNERSV